MARRFEKVSEEEIEEAFFYPSDIYSAYSAHIYIYIYTSRRFFLHICFLIISFGFRSTLTNMFKETGKHVIAEKATLFSHEPEFFLNS